MNQEQSAQAWMRSQAKMISPDLIKDNESILMCARVISGRIEELQNFIESVISDNQGSVFMLDKARKLLY